jgi:hypothetical protein
MASYFPPTENLPTFDSIVFSEPNTASISAAEAATKYLARVGANPTSIATKTTFNGNLELFNPSTSTIDNPVGVIRISGARIDLKADPITTNLQMNDSENVFNALPLKTGGDFTLRGDNPIISSDTTSTDFVIKTALTGSQLVLQSGVNPGITIDSSAIVNVRNTIRSANGTSGGFNLTNRGANTGNFLINNLQTASNMLYQQSGTTNSHIFSTNAAATTNLTMSNTANTFGTMGLASQGNLSLTGASPTISSTSTSSDFVIQNAATGSLMLLKSVGVTTLQLGGSTITTPTNSIINAGENLIFRTSAADATISATNSNLVIEPLNYIKLNSGVSFAPGPTITATANFTLALPVKSLYFINTGSGFTISLPTNSAALAGTTITFRRILASGNAIAFNQTGGASVMVATGFTVAGPSVTFPGASHSTQFISNGTNWYQQYQV